MWTLIKDDIADVRKALAGCRDMEHWETQCQVILKANSGVDFGEFLDYLSHGLDLLSLWPSSKEPLISHLPETLTRLAVILKEISEDAFTKSPEGATLIPSILDLQRRLETLQRE